MGRSVVSFTLAGLLLLASPGAAQGQSSGEAFPVACTFASTSGELEAEDACAAIDGATPVLAPYILGKLAYSKGLTSFAVHGGGWYYRRRDGTMRRMYIFDNGPDDFVQGLARALVDGKIAYVDRRMRIRIRTRYDWADRFDHGRAEVCVGCRAVLVGNGEQSMIGGGRWGVIDTSGREIVAVALSQTDFAARKDGRR